MNFSRRHLFGLIPGAGASVALSGCGSNTVSDAQAIVNDADAILSELNGLIPVPVSTLAGLVLTGFQALITAFQNAQTSGASTESTVLATLISAVKSVQADTTAGSAVNTDAGTALGLLEGLSANASASAQAQAEAAVGTVLIAYLEVNAPSSATAAGTPSKVTDYFNDAKTHITNLQNYKG